MSLRRPACSCRSSIRLAPIQSCAIALLVLLLSACGSAARGMAQEGMPEREMGMMPRGDLLTDFATLVPPRRPNNWLIAPSSFGPGTPDETAPTFGVPAERLAAIWVAIIKEQPRTRVLGVSEDGLQIEAEQESAMFGFTDRISVRVLPVDAERSTLVAYSRAEAGYWDLGVNRSRLRKWLTTLQARTGSL